MGSLVKRDLGRLGEATLQAWCADSGATCNRAVEDKAGWDYLVEIPTPAGDSATPLDRRPGDVRCLVQVKSSDGKTRRRQVKLRNWSRLVSAPMPCFLLLLEFDGGRDCQRAFLHHVWEPSMTRVLRRLRELSVEGVTDPSTRTLSLAWSDTDRLPEPTGAHLLDAITLAVGADPRAYAKRKSTLFETIGYDGQPNARMVAEILAPEGWSGTFHELLADVQLGLIPHLEAADGRIWDNRFGLMTSEPQKVLRKRGLLRPVPSESPHLEQVEFRSGERVLRVQAEVRVASLVPGEPTSLADYKYRLILPHGDVTCAPGTGEAVVRWKWPDPDEATRLRELLPICALLRLLQRATEPVGLSLSAVPYPPINPMTDALPDFDNELVDAVLDAWRLAQVADLEDVSVRLRHVHGQAETLRLIGRVLQRGPFEAVIVVEPTQPVKGRPTRVACPQAHSVALGDELVFLPVLYVGRGSITMLEGRPHWAIWAEDARIDSPLLAREGLPVKEQHLLERAASLAMSEEVLVWWEDDQ